MPLSDSRTQASLHGSPSASQTAKTLLFSSCCRSCFPLHDPTRSPRVPACLQRRARRSPCQISAPTPLRGQRGAARCPERTWALHHQKQCVLRAHGHARWVTHLPCSLAQSPFRTRTPLNPSSGLKPRTSTGSHEDKEWWIDTTGFDAATDPRVANLVSAIWPSYNIKSVKDLEPGRFYTASIVRWAELEGLPPPSTLGPAFAHHGK